MLEKKMVPSPGFEPGVCGWPLDDGGVFPKSVFQLQSAALASLC